MLSETTDTFGLSLNPPISHTQDVWATLGDGSPSTVLRSAGSESSGSLTKMEINRLHTNLVNKKIMGNAETCMLPSPSGDSAEF